MAIKDRMQNAKPFVWGFISGIVFALVVGFATGWVVTSGAKERAVETATIERLATVCATQAKEHWLAQGEELVGLHGWDNREQRETLANEFTAPLRVEDAFQRDVLRECARMLDA